MFVSEIPYERILFAYYTHSVGYVIRCQVCIDIYTYICTHIYIYLYITNRKCITIFQRCHCQCLVILLVFFLGSKDGAHAKHNEETGDNVGTPTGL